jgi:hypothetical protein
VEAIELDFGFAPWSALLKTLGFSAEASLRGSDLDLSPESSKRSIFC